MVVFRPNLGACLDKIRGMRSANSVPFRPKLGRCWPSLLHVRPILEHFDQVEGAFHLILAVPGRVRTKSDQSPGGIWAQVRGQNRRAKQKRLRIGSNKCCRRSACEARQLHAFKKEQPRTCALEFRNPCPPRPLGQRVIWRAGAAVGARRNMREHVFNIS